MYGSERYTLPLSRPFPVYIPRPITNIDTSNSIETDSRTSVFPQRRGGINGELLNDEYSSYHHDLSSAEISTENHRNELLSPEQLREFSCFGSYTSTLTDHPGSNIVSTSFMPAAVASVSHYVPTVIPNTVPAPVSVPVPVPVPVPESELGTDYEGVSSRDEEDSRKPPEERQRKRSKNWTRPETLKLISVRRDIDSKFLRSGRKSELWDQIAEALRCNGFSRDAQQCKDKWEKLCASYKEVGEGTREKEDFIYHDEIHSILSGRSKKRERERETSFEATKDKQGMAGPIEESDLDLSGEFGFQEEDSPHIHNAFTDIHSEHTMSDQHHIRRSKKASIEYVSVADIPAIHKLMDTLLAKQQEFFADLLNTMEKRDEVKEKLRQEREDRWRTEELEQRKVFNNSMLMLIQRLIGEERDDGGEPIAIGDSCDITCLDEQGVKKRSRNWKRSEVLQLIKLRVEMDSRFTMPMRRGSLLWDEISEILGAKGIQKDGKQCREKWDKLMIEFKDVSDGTRDPSESPFFLELKSFIKHLSHCDS